ncbi:MAG: DNA pilot protein [Arizlama microvirus]|nr:MAG: DNA pilot protein [Arizlama microvirus]
MSFWKKLGKGLKKLAPIAGAAAGFIPGVGPALGGMISKVGQAFGGSSAQSNSFTPDPAAANMDDYTGRPSVPVTGQRPGFDWSGAIGGIAPIGAAALNYLGQKNTNVANAQQAQAQMDFQAQQTSTAYQRGTADMKAAGLNPMLAYSQGGAQSGAGAQATMGNELGAGANSALSAAQTIQEMRKRSAEMDQLYAQTDLTKAQAAQSDAQTLQIGAGTKNLGMDYILKEIQSRYHEDAQRSAIRLTNSSAGLNEARRPLQEGLSKGGDLFGRGIDAISNARDAASDWLSDQVQSAEEGLRSWSQTRKRKH